MPVFATANRDTFLGVQLGQVAIYCRVSTDDQSCGRQERDLRAFARRAGHKVVAVFKETPSGSKNDRVGRKAMALAQAREIAAILVTGLSRVDVEYDELACAIAGSFGQPRGNAALPQQVRSG